MDEFEQELQSCLQVLIEGGCIMLTTDFGLCVACDATNGAAVKMLQENYPGGESRELPVLLTEERDVLQWVAIADLAAFDHAAELHGPTAIRFDHGLGFAESLPAPDGSVLVVLTQDVFCRHLVKRLRRPLAALPLACEADVAIPSIVAYRTKASMQVPAINALLMVLEWKAGKPDVYPFD